MAHFFAGKSICRFCGKPIYAEEDYTGFPAFLRDEHPLWEYADATFHQSCFDAWEERDTFLSLYREWRSIYESRPRHLSLEEVDAWGTKVLGEFHRKSVAEYRPPERKRQNDSTTG